jgi:long-chain acyl-CoA synthetase
VICRNARCFGNKEAWWDAEEGRSITFEQYKEQADRLASGLKILGIRKGDRIGVIGKNSLEFFLVYGGASALGAIVLPINWRLSADEMAYNLKDCTPRVVFADNEFQGILEKIRPEIPFVEAYFNLESKGGGFRPFEDLLSKPAQERSDDVSGEDGFVIIHTAAVAGRPRGALLSHSNVLCADLHFAYYIKITPDDVNMNILPLFHVGGLFTATAMFHAGGLNLNVRKFDPERVLKLIEEKRASFMVEFPPILSTLLDLKEKTGGDISSLRAVGGLETRETIERYQKITGGTFFCLYGQTETSCIATFGPYNERPGSAGRPLPLAEVRLVDEYDRFVPTGTVGEIVVKGPMVFKGYWNLEQENAYTFREGWHHTGDMGRFDDDGFLWYAGRKAEKELIKPGGENVYPAEVEKVIMQHPAVEGTVVFGVPDPKWKEGIKAVCSLRPGMSLGEKELIDFVADRLARYKKPHYVQFVDEIPLGNDGNPDRAKVKELYGERD